MKPTVTAVRAIGVEFASRTLRPLIVAGAVVALVLIGIGGWLALGNVWWWFLEVPILMAASLFAILVIIAQTAIRAVNPVQTSEQKAAVRDYVDKLQRVSSNLHTPQFIVAYRVIRDTVRPRPGGFIETISRDSKSLAPDFAKLLRHFS